MSNVWLFGPPGIGKSTIVQMAQDSGTFGFDFESIWGDQKAIDAVLLALQCTNPQNSFAIIGTAGLDPKIRYNGFKVLLTLSQSHYEERRLTRDIRVKEKAQQDRHLVSHWRALTDWDATVVANDQAFNVILGLIRKIKERPTHPTSVSGHSALEKAGS